MTCAAQRTSGDGVGGKEATLDTEVGVVGTRRVEKVLRGKKVISSSVLLIPPTLHLSLVL